MGFRHGTIAALGLILALPPAWARAADAPPTRPAHAEENNSPVDELVPKLDADGVRLGDFVTMLSDQWTDVQIVQFSGPWQDLTLPSLHLRNVTREQVLMLLGNMYPDLFIHPLQENTGLFGGSGNIHGKDVWVFQQVQSASAPVRTRVSAFGLTQTVDRLLFHRMVVAAISEPEAHVKGEKSSQIQGPDKDAEQKALKDVLSLIQATLDQSAEPDITPTVMLHEPTETVLVKGTPSQIAAVEQALQALDTSTSERSLESKLLQVTSENNVLRQTLRASRQRDERSEAVPKAADQDKPGSKQ